MGMDRQIEKKRGIKPKHIIIVLSCVFIVTLLSISLFGEHLTTYKTDQDKLTISSVTKSQFNDYINLNGTVEPIANIYINSFEQGVVDTRFVENGAIVSKGEPIIQLSNPQLLLEIQNADAKFAKEQGDYQKQVAQMEKDKIQLQQSQMTSALEVTRAKREFEQKKAMYEDGMGTREEFVRAEENYTLQLSKDKFLKKSHHQDSIYQVSQMKQLSESMEMNRLNHQEQKKRADRLIIRALIAGQLGQLNIELGQRVQANQSVGVISDLSDHKVSAMIDEYYIDRVREQLSATIDRNNRQYSLHIQRVYPEVSNGQFKVDFVFDDKKPDNIRTGQTNYIKVELGEAKEAILIPRGSFFQSTGGQWIFVLDQSGDFAIRRSIKIGRQNPKFYEVIEGLEPGEQVITSSYDTFGDAEKIAF